MQIVESIENFKHQLSALEHQVKSKNGRSNENTPQTMNENVVTVSSHLNRNN